MDSFNSKLVDYLDVLNKFLAGVFAAVAAFKCIDLLLELNFLGAIFETLSIVGLGVLTCGYIALMLSIANTLTEIRDRLKK